MQLKIEINLDNDSYQGRQAEELGENLEKIITALSFGGGSGTIHDSNGNKTGYWLIKED
jgi:hypothetical protein